MNDHQNLAGNKKPTNWTYEYFMLVERNIGPITYEEQELLRTSPIAIMGLGGLGGSIAEQLVRCGCEYLIICDNDIFEYSNLNRQLCTISDIGKYKVVVIANLLHNINPRIKLRKEYKITEKNISHFLKDITILVLALDDPIISILLARYCRTHDIPMIEAWGFPYLCAWWFTSKNIDYETCFGLETHSKSFTKLMDSEKEQLSVHKALLPNAFLFPGLKETYDREQGTIEEMIKGNLSLRSFAPIIRLTASYLTFDVIFSGILKIKPMSLAPDVCGFDYLRMIPFAFQFKR